MPVSYRSVNHRGAVNPDATPDQPARPVKLQANDSGAWKNVVRWDASDDDKSDDVMAAAIVLQLACPTTTFRIVTAAGDPLRTLTKGEWKDWRAAA